jgi:ribosome-associated heat shock protein Hsp15
MRKADPAGAGKSTAAGTDRLRFDKWLWAARFYKTRTLAAQAIDAGQARLNDGRVKPAHAVRAGDTVSVRKASLAWCVAVVAVADRRGSAATAAALYRESEESVAERNEEGLRRKAAAAAETRFPGRPTKRQRRQLADFLDEA